MTAANASSAGTAQPCRISHFDPFSIEFFDDLYPTQELLREAGPLVYLDKWKRLWRGALCGGACRAERSRRRSVRAAASA